MPGLCLWCIYFLYPSLSTVSKSVVGLIIKVLHNQEFKLCEGTDEDKANLLIEIWNTDRLLHQFSVSVKVNLTILVKPTDVENVF